MWQCAETSATAAPGVVTHRDLVEPANKVVVVEIEVTEY